MANFKSYEDMLKYLQQNEPELRTKIGATNYNQLRDYATIKTTSQVFGDQYAKDNVAQLDYLYQNRSSMDKTEFNNYWKYYSSAAQTELKYASKAYESGVIGIPQDTFQQNAALSSNYFYDSDDEEDTWRQMYGIAPKAIDNAVKKAQRTGYDAARYYKDEEGRILASRYWYDENDADDVLNMLYGRTPKAFKYDTTDEDKIRERDGRMPLAAETYIKNTRQFQGEYSEYAAAMQDYANKKYVYESKDPLARLFEAAPKNPYESDESLPQTVRDLKTYKLNQLDADLKRQIEGYDYFTETGEPKVKDAEKPHFMFSDTLPVRTDDFTPDETALKWQSIVDEVMKPDENKVSETAKAVNVRGYAMPGEVSKMNAESSARGKAYQQIAEAREKRKEAESVANETIEQDAIAKLKETGEWDRIIADQAKALELLDEEYSADNLAFIKESLAYDTEFGMTEKLVKDLTMERLTLTGASQDVLGLYQVAGAIISPRLENNAANASADAELREIGDQLRALGWNGERESEDKAIQELLEKAEFKTMQTRKDRLQEHFEFLKTQPAWMVNVVNGIEAGSRSFFESVANVVLETGKVLTQGQFNEFIDPVIGDIATQSVANDTIMRQFGREAKGATEFTDTLYDVSKVVTEMGINIAIGNVIGKAVSGAKAAKLAGDTASALTGWKAVASKALLKPNLIPIFTTSLGHNLMHGTLEGRSDEEKWLSALPSAYFEAQIESMFGFFSGRSAPLATLVRKGSEKALPQTLKSIAMMVLENTLGETVEEILQDQVGEFFRGAVWNGYEPEYFNLEQMGETAKITAMVGVLLSVFSIPGAARSQIRTVRGVEKSINNVADAHARGDVEAVQKHALELKTHMNDALDTMRSSIEDGSMDKILEMMQLDADTNAAMGEMSDAVRVATELRAMRDAGQDISQNAIDAADARANQSMQAVRIGATGRAEVAATMYDQVSTSQELTQMMQKSGYAAQLMETTRTVMTPEQIGILQKIEQTADRNSFVDMRFPETVTEQTLTKRVEKDTQKLTEARAQYKNWQARMKQQIFDAHKISKEEARRVKKIETERGQKLKQDILEASNNVLDDKQMLAAFKFQLEQGAAFVNAGAQDIVAQAQQYATEFVPQEGAPQAQTAQTDENGEIQADARKSPQGAQAASQRAAEWIRLTEQQAAEKQQARIDTMRTVFVDQKSDVPGETAAKILDRHNRVVALYEAAHEPDLKDFARHQRIDALMNEVELSTLLGQLRNTWVTWNDGIVYDVSRRHLEQRMALKEKQQIGYGMDQDPDMTLRALDNALDIIKRGNEYVEQGRADRAATISEARRNAIPKVQEKLDLPGDKAISESKGLAYLAKNMLGTGAMNADQFALSVSGNNINSALHNLLYKDADKSQNTFAWIKRSDTWLFEQFFDRPDVKPLMKEFVTRANYSYTFEDGTARNLTLNDIAAIHLNYIGGNDMTKGIRLSTGKDVAGVSTDVAGEISSIITGVNAGKQAQKIAAQIGDSKLATTREIVDFAWKYFNEYTYVNDIGETVPGPKARANIAGQEVYGINRAVSGPYFPSNPIYRTPQKRQSTGDDTGREPPRSYLQVRGDDGGMLQMQNLVDLLDTRSYETAHSAAWDGHIRRVYHAFYAPKGEIGLHEAIQQTHGDQYADWLYKYRRAIDRPIPDVGDLSRFGQSIYNLAKLRRLITPTVWAKQAGSLLHAAAYLDMQYFPSLTQKLSDQQLNDIKKYYPELLLRDRGFALKETTEIAASRRRRTQAFMAPLLAVDQWTVQRVWLWADKQVRAQNPNLTGDALGQKIAQTAADAVNKTQPTFAPHITSMLLNEQGFLPRMLTMYTTATNSVYNTAIGGFRDIKSGNYASGARKIASATASMVSAWALGRFVTEAFRGFSGGDDDETVGDVLLDIGMEMTAMVYGVRTIVSTLKYSIQYNRPQVSIPALEEINGILAGIVGMYTNMNSIGEAEAAYADTGDEKDKERADKGRARIMGDIRTLTLNTAHLLGVPLGTVEKYLVKPMVQIAWGEKGISDYNAALGYGMEASSNYKDLQKALSKGDDKMAMRYLEIIADKDGNADNFLAAKTGGRDLEIETKMKVKQLWADLQLKIALDKDLYAD